MSARANSTMSSEHTTPERAKRDQDPRRRPRRPAPPSGPGAAVLRLQKAAGNQAIARLLGEGQEASSPAGPGPTAAPQTPAQSASHAPARSWWRDALGGLAAAARERLLGPLAGIARRVPGYELLAVALGRDPISGRPAERGREAVLRALIALVPGGAAVMANLQQSGALQRAGAWLSSAVPKLGLTWEAIGGLFARAFGALKASDVLNPGAAWARLGGIFEPPLTRLRAFASAALGKLRELAFEAALAMGGGLAGQVMAVLRRGGSVLGSIFANPVGFAGNLMEAVRGGLGRFASNIGTHLRTGLFGWLFGALRGVIEMPQRFDLRGVGSVVLQLLGLTWGRLRERLVGRLGAPRVAFIERSVDFVRRIATEGLSAVWAKILEFASGLTDTVVGAIREWVTNSIVGAAIARLVTMFNPVGAVIQAILSIYRGIQWLIQRADQLRALASSIFDSLAAIASGSLGGAIAAVENALARTLPVVISFLASQLGLGNIGEHVRRVVDRVRGVVERAIGRVVDWIAARFRRSSSEKTEETAHAAGTEKVKRDALADARHALRARKVESAEHVGSVLREVHQRHRPRGLRQLALRVTDPDRMTLSIEAKASPALQEDIAWTEVFSAHGASPLPDLIPDFEEQGWRTHAALSVNGRLVAHSTDGANQHAEERLLSNGDWEKALRIADEAAADANGNRVTLALVINRSPCHSICTPKLAAAIGEAKARTADGGNGLAFKHLDRVDFVLAPTGTYEPNEKMSEEEQQSYRAELEKAHSLSPKDVKKAMLKEKWRRKAKPGQERVADITRVSDLGELAKGQWDVRLLRTGGKASDRAEQWLMAVRRLKRRIAELVTASSSSS
jgi:hypothetical protein